MLRTLKKDTQNVYRKLYFKNKKYWRSVLSYVPTCQNVILHIFRIENAFWT